MELKDGVGSEYNEQFLQGMIDRMSVSFYKYGAVAEARGFDNLANLEKRVAQYRETGNTEWLIDAANFAMIEFMFPQHVDAHYRATDSSESPGRHTSDGRTVKGPNRPAFHPADRSGD